MKVNCRACDICGEQLGSRDFQYKMGRTVSWNASHGYLFGLL